MNSCVRIWASITFIFFCCLHFICSAICIAVNRLIISATTVFRPYSKAVHRLGTALRGALLVGMSVSTSVAIVGVICADGIVSAAPVLVVLDVMEARAVGTPVSNTVHRLAALFVTAFNSAML